MFLLLYVMIAFLKKINHYNTHTHTHKPKHVNSSLIRTYMPDTFSALIIAKVHN